MTDPQQPQPEPPPEPTDGHDDVVPVDSYADPDGFPPADEEG